MVVGSGVVQRGSPPPPPGGRGRKLGFSANRARVGRSTGALGGPSRAKSGTTIVVLVWS